MAFNEKTRLLLSDRTEPPHTIQTTMAFNEKNRLLFQTEIVPPRKQYIPRLFRHLCISILVTVFVVSVCLFARKNDWAQGPNIFGRWPLRSEGLSFKELQEILLTAPQEDKAREWNQYYSAGPHLAGKNLSQAIWTRELWQGFGIQDSNLVAYDVYINYPAGHRLALLERNQNNGSHSTGNDKASDTVSYECKLEEDVLKEDPTTGLADRIPTFHGYSASGNVTAQYVYVNHGTSGDYEDLVKANVSLKGKIAVARYGSNFRGLKIELAHELGMVGVVMYSDPGDDGDITEENGYKPYPDGPARNPSSVQRGSVQYLNKLSGDPTTSGYPSKPGVPRSNASDFTPSIPSLPISYQDALPLLKALNGHGPKASQFNEYWQGGGLQYKGVDYNIGPSPSNIVLNLVNQQEYTITPIWNVIGIINGTLSDEVIILGNHRDAWIAGGAGDPNSGSAALNEVIRSFGIALRQGWKPLRTIVFASWDGEEYGLVGSTEWVEEYIPWLSQAAIAYLNVDVAVKGNVFSVTSNPLLHKVVHAAASLVPSPNQTITGQTVSDLWGGKIPTLGSGSDFASFQHVIGIPAIDMSFKSTEKSPVYQYHSNYDSFTWMERFGDPGFHYHVAITKVWALTAASLIESPVIPLNVTDFAYGLSSYHGILSKIASNSSDPSIRALSHFAELRQAIEVLTAVAIGFDARAADLASSIDEDIPWWKWWRKIQLYYKIKKINGKYKLFERQFLYPKGLDGRPFYKHTIFAPEYFTAYGGVTFPGLRESVDKQNIEGVGRWNAIIIGKINTATEFLKA